MSAVDTFERIIRHLSVHQLVPFLLALDKKEQLDVRAKTKALYRELTEFRQLGGITWGRTGTESQLAMLFLAGIATYTRKEAAGLAESLGMYWGEGDVRAAHQQYFFTVAEHARPNWLGEWIERQTRNNFWGLPDYRLLRELEVRQLLDYAPALFARTLAQWPAKLSNFRRAKQLAPDYLAKVLQEFQRHPDALRRDTLAFFDYDTSVDSVIAYTNVAHQHVTWLDLLRQLTAAGHLERTELLTRSLEALRRDFRRPLLTWFKNLFLALQPTTAESLDHQQALVELLSHPQAQVVNFALGQLKSIWMEPAFEPAALLLYAETVFTRSDLKTAQRTLFSGFEKLLKRDPALAATLGRLAVAALVNADATVQAKAAKLLASLLQAKKPLLTAEEATELTNSLALYGDLLAAEARQLLAPWLTPAAAPASAGVAYAPHPGFVPDLSAGNAVVPVADWHELLFLTGQVLRHDSALELERWLDGLRWLQPQFPADYAQQLLPYLVQVRPFLKGKIGKQAEAIIAGNGLAGHQGLVEALLLGWAQGFSKERVPKVNVRHDRDTSDPLVLVQQRRFGAAEQHLLTRSGLPLLSTPTHAPHWVAPTALVEKLLTYEAALADPDPADLAVALARIAYAHAADAQAALARLPQLQRPELRELLHWLLTPDEQPLPVHRLAKPSVLKHLTARLGKLLPGDAVGATTLADAWPWLWAVAARTRRPEGVFEELAAVIPTDYVGVVRPWTPAWQFEVKTNTWVENWKPGKPTVTHRYTVLQFPSKYTSQTPPSPLLLYSQHARYSGMNAAGWLLPHDYRFVASLVPHNPVPLHWHVVRTATWTDGLESTERDTMQAALQELLGLGPVFAEATILLLALGLLHKVPACRALALEVFLAACATGRLLPSALGTTLGQLLAAEFVPVQRLADNLQQARAIDATTDDALQQVLNALLAELPVTPLRNTKKLVELYADLASRTARRPTQLTAEKLRAWKATAALKKAVGALA